MIYFFRTAILGICLFVFSPLAGENWISSPSSDFEKYFARGYNSYLNEEYYESLRAYTIAYLFNPCSRELLNNLGLIYKIFGDSRRAEIFFKKSLQCDSNFLYPRINLGIIFYEQRRWEELFGESEAIIRDHPDSGWAYFARGYAQYRMGRYLAARKDLQFSLGFPEPEELDYHSEARRILRKIDLRTGVSSGQEKNSRGR